VNNGALPLNAIAVIVDPPEGDPEMQKRVFLKGRLGWLGFTPIPRS